MTYRQLLSAYLKAIELNEALEEARSATYSPRRHPRPAEEQDKLEAAAQTAENEFDAEIDFSTHY
jgi:hypothetical protein